MHVNAAKRTPPRWRERQTEERSVSGRRARRCRLESANALDFQLRGRGTAPPELGRRGPPAPRDRRAESEAAAGRWRPADAVVFAGAPHPHLLREQNLSIAELAVQEEAQGSGSRDQQL